MMTVDRGVRCVFANSLWVRHCARVLVLIFINERNQVDGNMRRWNVGKETHMQLNAELWTSDTVAVAHWATCTVHTSATQFLPMFTNRSKMFLCNWSLNQFHPLSILMENGVACRSWCKCIFSKCREFDTLPIWSGHKGRLRYVIL